MSRKALVPFILILLAALLAGSSTAPAKAAAKVCSGGRTGAFFSPQRPRLNQIVTVRVYTMPSFPQQGTSSIIYGGKIIGNAPLRFGAPTPDKYYFSAFTFKATKVGTWKMSWSIPGGGCRSLQTGSASISVSK